MFHQAPKIQAQDKLSGSIINPFTTRLLGAYKMLQNFLLQATNSPEIMYHISPYALRDTTV